MSLHAGRATTSPPLHQESSDLSDYTVDSTSTVVETPVSALTPGSPFKHRPGYRRIASLNDQDTAYRGSTYKPHRSEESNGHGLGIKNLERLPFASPGEGSHPATPGSANPLLSPASVQSQKAYRPLDDPISEGNEVWEESYARTEPYQPFVVDSETESLRRHTTGPTVQSFEPPGMLKCSSIPDYPRALFSISLEGHSDEGDTSSIMF